MFILIPVGAHPKIVSVNCMSCFIQEYLQNLEIDGKLNESAHTIKYDFISSKTLSSLKTSRKILSLCYSDKENL
ncbi:hypothetical protein BpHYR1_036681 [Brachionus plicatilis]|uniref:Uncharacterized protein n=1 Tax=Brachionus plicatilis TaxID=10195 RepID=A0A3M7QLK9_BRAPC|nr:hypothetical protein BpHYR1_036681 [Brachionus plicatilis]